MAGTYIAAVPRRRTASLTDSLARLTAALADRYTVERQLGRGGMATVYLAHDRKHRRRVALKVLHPELAYALGADRFRREIDTAANLSHPHILPLHDSGEVDGLFYYVMPFVEGESLRDRLNRETQLPMEQALRIAREVADALNYAHGQGVIHRDIKPENILLSGEHALVADFGIARALAGGGAGATGRLTETGMAIGTPAYMSPEQASGGGELDGRSDVYSLGCVLYEMLVGAPPFVGPSAQALLAQHALDPVPRLRTRRATVTPGVEQAVLKALAKAPADRFATAGQFSQALATGDTLELPGPARRLARRGLIAVGATVVLALVAAATLLWRQRTPTRALDANVVAVAPFRVTSADPALGYLHEGMVDLLAAKLTGQGGPRAADPRSVLSAWRRASGSDTGELPRDAALTVAERLGVGQLLIGNVVGAPGRIVLNASVVAVPGGQARAQTSVEGPIDSLPNLVDQLAAKLLTLGADEGEQRLSALTSTSLPAVRAYLEGQALYRRGKPAEAATQFGRALDLDSAFVLAALGLLASGNRTGDREVVSRGRDLAWAARDRLTPRDLAYMMAIRYDDTTSYSRVLFAAEQFVRLAPDRAEAWFTLGEALYNFGEMLGVPNAQGRAAAAYRRAVELDASFAPAREGVVMTAARSGDTATVRRFGGRYLSHDSAGGASVVRWRVAVALGDSLGLKRLRANFDTMSTEDLYPIGQLSQYDGVALEDADRATTLMLKRESRSRLRFAWLAEVATLALNRGRPAAARRVRKEQEANANAPPDMFPVVDPVLDALYWDGDSGTGATAAQELGAIADALSPDDAIKRRRAYSCVVEQWRLAHGQLGTARRAIAQLRTAKAPQDDTQGVMFSHGCAILLDALLAAAEKRADAGVYLERLDSLMRTGPPYRHYDQSWNLVVARLKEAEGDRQGALAATRRRLYFFAEPVFLSTYLREEGRLAALTGDRAGAIRAYGHYLTLRADPEPVLRPQVEHVRAELAQLLEEPVQ